MNDFKFFSKSKEMRSQTMNEIKENKIRKLKKFSKENFAGSFKKCKGCCDKCMRFPRGVL